MARPAAVEPVNATLSTPGCPTRYSPVSRPPGTMLTTPGGRPAASAASAIWNASSAVSGAGLITTVQPAASAGASLNMVSDCGKFHGTIAATTPIGSRRTTVTPRPLTAVRRSSTGVVRHSSA